MNKTIIIAEVGVNHNGDFAKAKEFIKVCSEIGIDYIKFQTFKAEGVVTADAAMAEYQKRELPQYSTQLDMIRSLEFSESQFIDLIEYSSSLGLNFLTTAFDFESANFVNGLGLDYCKIPSGEITNFPLIDILCQSHEKFIVSTGMSTESEIDQVLEFLKLKGKNEIILMHCISEYPSPYDEMNLNSIKTLSSRFGLPIGLSDHSLGTHIPIAAVALGAVAIEKHITFDNFAIGPDHKSSLLVDDFAKMVKQIRDLESALGDGIIGISHSEKKNIDLVRKSIVAKSAISVGEIFTELNLTTKRPGTGISAVHWYKLLNKKAKKSYMKDEMISIEEDWSHNN